MVNGILSASLFIMMLSIVLVFIRFVKGKSIIDRLISFDTATIISLSLIIGIAHLADRMIYIDVALVYGLLSFLGVIIFAKYIDKGL